MKKFFKIFFLTLVIVLLLIQFIPQNLNNRSTVTTANDVSLAAHTGDTVKQLLQTSCYDCHSNHTIYPWYAHVQPFAWWLSSHIKDGKKRLNFSEFGLLGDKKKKKKLKGIIEQLKEDEMPLKSYLLIHTNAKLTTEQKAQIIEWAKREEGS